MFIFSKDKEELFKIEIDKDKIAFWKDWGEEWTGFSIYEKDNGWVRVFTGNKNGQAEQVEFL